MSEHHLRTCGEVLRLSCGWVVEVFLEIWGRNTVKRVSDWKIKLVYRIYLHWSNNTEIVSEEDRSHGGENAHKELHKLTLALSGESSDTYLVDLRLENHDCDWCDINLQWRAILQRIRFDKSYFAGKWCAFICNPMERPFLAFIDHESTNLDNRPMRGKDWGSSVNAGSSTKIQLSSIVHWPVNTSSLLQVTGLAWTVRW